MEEIFSAELGNSESGFAYGLLTITWVIVLNIQFQQIVAFDRYLDGFKNMLKSVKFTPPIPEKKPSFLNSSEIANIITIDPDSARRTLSKYSVLMTLSTLSDTYM